MPAEIIHHNYQLFHKNQQMRGVLNITMKITEGELVPTVFSKLYVNAPEHRLIKHDEKKKKRKRKEKKEIK